MNLLEAGAMLKMSAGPIGALVTALPVLRRVFNWQEPFRVEVLPELRKTQDALAAESVENRRRAVVTRNKLEAVEAFEQHMHETGLQETYPILARASMYQEARNTIRGADMDEDLKEDTLAELEERRLHSRRGVVPRGRMPLFPRRRAIGQ
jgi:hypothetical protein